MAMMIGVFDSGFGGLTVLSAFLEEMPEYDYIYLGDSARAPYGGHSKEAILRYTREGVEFLFEKGARVVILACNTASSLALRELQNELIVEPGVKDRNILGVVVPIAEAIAGGDYKRVALIGTKGTLASGAYEEELRKKGCNAELKTKACPLLVPMIEEGWAEKMETKRILKSYLRELKFWNPEVLVPACTHYPLLKKGIKQIMGRNVELLDTGKIIADSLKDYLKRHDEFELSKGGKREFWCTDCPDHFKELGSKFLGEEIKAVDCAIISKT
jgi:glutamate racemase